MTQDRPLSNVRLVMPLTLTGPAHEPVINKGEDFSEETAGAADASSILAPLLALQRPVAAKGPSAPAQLLRRLCVRQRSHLTATAARLCERYDVLQHQQADSSSEQSTCPADGACSPPLEQQLPSPCSLLAALLQAREDGSCPLCALLHAAVHTDESHVAHVAHECPLCNMLSQQLPASAPAPVSVPPRKPRAVVLWLNPRTRRDWNVLNEKVPGE